MTNDPARTGEIVQAVPSRIELEGVPTTDLKQQLRDAIGMTETAIRQVASIWQELVRRGEDLSDIRFALAPFMAPVDEGRLLPGLVVAMAGQVRSLQRLAELPTEMQAELLAGKHTPVLKLDRGVIEKPLKSLSFPEITAVVRDGTILTPEQQRQNALRAPRRMPRKSTYVNIRLAPETYQEAALAAADADMAMDDYLRRLIIAGLRRSQGARS